VGKREGRGEEALTQIYRVLKPNSFCVTFYGYPKLDAFVHAWTTAGFHTVGHIVWTKPYASSARFVRVTHESAYVQAAGFPALAPPDFVV
jgi:adenine-specific DNA-methyltransferase